ncbi:MAG: transposase [Thermoguttaceae bacterium]
MKLLKIGALVRTTLRRVCISLSESCPYQHLFAQVHDNLRRWPLPLADSG